MTQSRVDLHLHTTASDGVLSPTALVDLCATRGLETMAVTDHDSTESIAEARRAAQRHAGLQVIAGIELGAETEAADIHILGYFIDVESTPLQRLLETLRSARLDRAKRIIARLGDLGLDITLARVLELAAGGAVGRLHIAQALRERDYVSSLGEAFDLYIGQGRPAYVSRYRLPPAEAIQTIRDVGGVATMAHPMDVQPLVPTVEDLARLGLGGLECYYPGYTPETTRSLVELAEGLGLIPTGGTDFHGREAGAELGPGSVYVPPETPRRLAAMAGGKHRRRDVGA